MSSEPSNSGNGVLCDKLLGYAKVLTIELCFIFGRFRGYITRFPGTRVEALTKDESVPSSERAPHSNKTVTVKQ
jgi:hypothetical protein